MTGVLRKRVRANFTVLSNNTIRDSQLSFRAVGVLTHILSLKDGSPISAEELALAHTEGRDAVAAALKELTKAGYYRTTKRQGPDGRWVTEVEVGSERGLLTEPGFSGPGDGGSPTPGKPTSGKPTSGAPTSGEPTSGQPTSGNPCSRSEVLVQERVQELTPASTTSTLRTALIDVCGLTGSTPTRSEAGAWAKATADLAAVEATPDTIRAHAAVYRRRWPAATLTPTALARHWSECNPSIESPSAEELDPFERARALARTYARSDFSEEQAMGARPADIAEAAIFREAFLEERTRLARSS